MKLRRQLVRHLGGRHQVFRLRSDGCQQVVRRPVLLAQLADLTLQGRDSPSERQDLIGVMERTDLPEHGSSPAATEASGKTILVVDDETEIRKLLVRLLTRAGHHVIEADKGLTALKLVKERHPDLIVLDAMLPEVHGFDIARRIKGSQRYGKIPIIMVSAVYRGWRYAEDLKASCGVDHFIEKPFRIAEVLAAVDASLRQTSPSPEPDVSAEAEAALNAGVQAYKAGRLDEAIAHLKRGIGIDPLAYRLHFHLGLLYGKRGQVYDAVSELETAVEINSRHFPAVKNLAILYQKAGFRNKAVEMWGRALSLAPEDETRQSIREHLLNLL
jgi:DNA-binding response OmpR family regulator